MSTLTFPAGTRGRWIRQGNRILLFPAAPYRAGWEGELEDSTAGQLRIVIFYGYSGAVGDGVVERDNSNQLVARTLKEHLAIRFPKDRIDVVCAWHKNNFVKELIATPLKLRQIHYCGHGFMGGLYMGYHNRVAVDERGAMIARFADPADAWGALSDTGKRKIALQRDAGLMSGYFTDALSSSRLATIKSNLAPGAMMQIWGCFAGAPSHTFDSSDAYWNLFNAAGTPVDGIAKHIAKSLGIECTAVTDPDGIHGMDYWFRDAAGKFDDEKRPERMPHWLWPSSSKVEWVTYDSSGTANKTTINVMGKGMSPKDLPGGTPPRWLTKELPLSLASKAVKPLPVCSAAFVTV